MENIGLTINGAFGIPLGFFSSENTVLAVDAIVDLLEPLVNTTARSISSTSNRGKLDSHAHGVCDHGEVRLSA